MGVASLFLLSAIPSVQAANPSTDLDQCANDAPVGSCTWQNGNLNSGNSHFAEGESVPYRVILENLASGTVYTVTIGWDIRHSSKNALDYLTHYDRIAETPNPCLGVTPCSLTGTFPIPAPASILVGATLQPQTSFNALPPAERVLSISGGTITAASYPTQGSLVAAQSESQLLITFTASGSTAVIAWGGHISRTADWGAGNSATGIGGSPYHMRTKALTEGGKNVNIGNEDRSMQSDTVIVQPAGASLTIVKEIRNDQGGLITLESAFSIHLLNPVNDVQDSPFDSPQPGDAIGTSYSNLPAGSYRVFETPPAGYAVQYSGDCASTGFITLAAGDIKECTVWNNDTGASLTVTKVVQNTDGGTAQVSSFSLFVDATQVTSGVARTFSAGTYAITETGPSGYAAAFTGDCSSLGQITLANGDSKSCTITNSDIRPRLTVIKVVNNTAGGLVGIGDFDLSVGSEPVDSGVTEGFNAGLYTVSESGPDGYLASFSGACDSQGQVSLSVGDNKTCTITNSDIDPLLTVVKVFNNTDGGLADLDDVDLFVDGSPVESGAQHAYDIGDHVVSEDGPDGYAAEFSEDCDAEGDVSLALADVKSCLITNDDIQPLLTVTKIVINDDGGTATVASFPLFVDETPVQNGTATGFSVGDYVVSETSLPGYAATFGGDCDVDGKVSLALADAKACTITNDDIQPILNVTKVVVNDHGGEATVGSFALSVGGDSVSSGVPHGFDAGPYQVSELGPGGYGLSYSGACAEGGLVTLVIGQTYECTLTNDDIQPILNVTKVVVNDHGGLALVSDFDLDVDGEAVLSGVPEGFNASATPYLIGESGGPSGYALSYSGDCDEDGFLQLFIGEEYECTLTNDDIQPTLTVHKVVDNGDGGTASAEDWSFFVGGVEVDLDVATGFNASQYAVSESGGPSGYSLSFSDDCDSDGNITLAIGEDYDCTLTNDDIEPILNVTKVVVNDHGGLALVSDFDLDVSGESVLSGVPEGFDAGDYQVSESGPDGYALSYSGACAEGGSLSLAIGQVYECKLTNDDIQPILNVTKVVVNDHGGAALVADFDLDVSGTAVTSGVPQGFNASATPYLVSESGPGGYALSFSGACAEGGLVTLALGQVYECVLTNDDIQPILNVTKVVVNDHGGLAIVTDTSLFVGDEPVGSGVPEGFNASASPYLVSELGPPGYAPTFTGDCDAGGNVSLAIGDVKHCILTNDDVQPILIVTKTVMTDDGGTAVVADFDLDVSGTSVSSGAPHGFNASAIPYVVSETGPAGYAATFGGDCDAGGNVTLALGDVKECTLLNDDIQPILNVTKVVVNDHGGAAIVADFDLDVSGESVLSGVPEGFDAGDYQVSESGPGGYALSYSGACAEGGSLSLAIGQVYECVLTNDDIQPILNVTKVVVNDHGGLALVSDFDLDVSGTAVTSGVRQGFNASATSYLVSESGPGGYALSFSGACAEGGLVTLAIGQTYECTLTNDDIQPILNVTKVVVNDHGGQAIVSDFDLDVGGVAVTSGIPQGFNASATPYQVSESGPDGYALSYSGACADGTVVLEIGQVYECVLTNDDIQPILNVTKVVVNDHGGPWGVGDFDLDVGGVAVTSGVPQGFNASATPYPVSESGPDGYALSYSGDCADGTVVLEIGEVYECVLTNDDIQPILNVTKIVDNGNGGLSLVSDFDLDVSGEPVGSGVPEGFNASASPYVVSESGPGGYDGSFSGDCDEGGNVTLSIGEVYECFLTNDDIQPILLVTKTVRNDHGGTANVTDFDLSVGLEPVVSGVPEGFDADTYRVSETGPAGYNATFGGDCDADGDVTLAIGQVKECTILNDDIQPVLTIHKEVITDSGGDASADDWDFTVGGSPIELDTATGVDAGTYAIAESGPAGYALSFSGDCDEDGNLTLAIGEEYGCTLTNDDIQPILNVTKVVVNDHGGLALVSDFDLDVGGEPVLSGVPAGFNASASPYQVSESGGPSGYALSYSGDCDEDGSIQLALGQVYECTLTNDDIQPKLTVRKDVTLDNGGDAEASDWDFAVGGVPVDLDVATGFNASQYTVSESGGPSGYSLSFSGDCDEDGNLTLAIGEEYECILTNDDQKASLLVIKHVINDSGGTKAAGNFTLVVSATNASATLVTGSETGVTVMVDAGVYMVMEPPAAGYNTSYSAGCAGTLAPGGSAVCTVTNNDTSQKRMTGGGSIGGSTVKHGFTLHCDKSQLPNRLEVNWKGSDKKEHKFHLELLTAADCRDDPAIKPKPPVAPFDTYTGAGTGRYDGVAGATASWTFTDAGEPGKLDRVATLVIKNAAGATVLTVSGSLDSGNHQAHK